MNLDIQKQNHYGVILADPPWRFRTFNEKGRKRCPDWKKFKDATAHHYETMSLEDIKKMPISDIASEDCVLLMWFSWPMLREALEVIEAWGFEYKTCAFSWMKANANQYDMFGEQPKTEIGLGYWTRSNNESCLLATRGKPKRLNSDVRQGIIEPRRQHSRKPDCIHGRVQRLVAGPYIELFARQKVNGWDTWGNQVQKFQERNPQTAPRGARVGGLSKPRQKDKTNARYTSKPGDGTRPKTAKGRTGNR